MSSLRVALVHNLNRGGAWRTMHEHSMLMGHETVEFCLQTATPVTSTPHLVPFAPRAEQMPPALRPIPRHVDLGMLVRAWREIAMAVNRAACDVVLAHPCQFLQAPLALRWTRPASVYFCHEPRRVDYEPAAAAGVNQRTRLIYAGLHRIERELDRVGVASADHLLTNSRFTAVRIAEAYGREAAPVPLGVADLFRKPFPAASHTHLLSVGSLIPSKGHDLAIRAAGLSSRRWPLIVIAPRHRPEEEARLNACARASEVELEIRVGVSDAELSGLYRGALATLYLAREEPLGLVSLEAQACGSPVIVADDGGLPETMIPEQSGWAVSRENVDAAAHAIDALEDPAVWQRFSAKAREHGHAQTWERSTAQVQAALERACEK